MELTLVKMFLMFMEVKAVIINLKMILLALIAVCNKLLKQCFAIAKSGLPYDETHVSVLSK